MTSKESITVRERSDVKVVDVNVDLGSYVAEDLRRTLDGLVSQKTRKILINLSQVQHICSIAIGTLVGTLRRLQLQGGDLKVFGLTDSIKELFDSVGLIGIVKIYDSESHAFNEF